MRNNGSLRGMQKECVHIKLHHLPLECFTKLRQSLGHDRGSGCQLWNLRPAYQNSLECFQRVYMVMNIEGSQTSVCLGKTTNLKLGIGIEDIDDTIDAYELLIHLI